MRILLWVGVFSLLSGCFWTSDPPDLTHNDKPIRLVVIWDKVISNSIIERSTWLTTDNTKLKKLAGLLNTSSWQSSSVLPAGHATRIILSMASGKVWEIVQSESKNGSLSMFDRNNRGWSGSISGSEVFIQQLTSMIESETGTAVALHKEYRKFIREGSMHKVIPAATQQQLNIYPGYPEIVWNKNAQKFEYAGDSSL